MRRMCRMWSRWRHSAGLQCALAAGRSVPAFSAKTRPVYDAYSKTGYSKRFLETHRTEITLHKAAKAAFDEADLKKLPKVKALDAEYSKLLTEKKARYPDYRKAKEEMQELLRAKKNVELFFAEEKSGAEKMKSR